MASELQEFSQREIVPDWLHEEMYGFVGTDGTYDHEGFIQHLQDMGYQYAVVDSVGIQDWGMQQAENLRQEEEI